MDVVVGLGPAIALAGALLVWFTIWWFVLPLRSRTQHLAEDCGEPAGPDADADTHALVGDEAQDGTDTIWPKQLLNHSGGRREPQQADDDEKQR